MGKLCLQAESLMQVKVASKTGEREKYFHTKFILKRLDGCEDDYINSHGNGNRPEADLRIFFIHAIMVLSAIVSNFVACSWS